MKDERLLKRSETKKQGGCSKRERAQLIWEDCLKRPDSPEKGREGEKWREKANKREQWKTITKENKRKNKMSVPKSVSSL